MKNFLKITAVIFILLLVFSACDNSKKTKGSSAGFALAAEFEGEEFLLADGKISRDSPVTGHEIIDGWTTPGFDIAGFWIKGEDGQIIFRPSGFPKRIYAQYFPKEDIKWEGKITGDSLVLENKSREGYIEFDIRINDSEAWTGAGEISLGLYEAANTEVEGNFVKLHLQSLGISPPADEWTTVKLTLRGVSSFGSTGLGNKIGCFSFFIIGLPDDNFELSLRNVKLIF